MSIALERLSAATYTLVGSAPIKERLTTAFRDQLAALDAGELPREAREDFAELCRAMQRERPQSRREDAVRATVRKMAMAEADRLAVLVVRMFCTVSRMTAQSAVVLPFSAASVAAMQAPADDELVEMLAAAER